jgi:hypothetical protein
MKAGYVKSGIGLASGLLLAMALGTASAADKWFVLGEKVLNSTDRATVIKAEEGKMWKDDVKKAKLSVEGADVEITNVVFHWRGGKDDSITNVGVLKAGAQTAEKDAPGRESTLTSVDVQYRILNNKPTATLKVWGFD